MKLKELIAKSTPLPWRMCAPYYAALTNETGGGLGTKGILAEFVDPQPEPSDIKLHNALLAAHAVNVLTELIAALELAATSIEYHHAHEGCPITRRIVRAAIKHASNINPRWLSPAHKTKGTKPYGRNS